jgi:molybdate/tungstate transport system substrate-binding protein
MWQFHTSMSAPTAIWVVVVVVVAGAAGGVGFFVGYEYRPSSVANSTLSILAAGTLDTLFPQLADALVNETPGISAPSAAQTYEGSIDITAAITSLAATADVAAVADYRLVPQMLEPKFASYEVVFGTTPEVLAYNPDVPGFSGINSTNWPTKLIDTIDNGSAPLGVWNASTDPNGYNEIFSMMLEGMIYDGGDVAAIYSHFYTGAPGSCAFPIAGKALYEHEAQAANLISTGVVSAVITYRAYAIVNHLTYVSFNPIVGLLANNTTALADYSKLSTSIIGSTGRFISVVPAPVLFSVTVPLNAENPALGAAFLHLLLSPQGTAILSEGGAFTPIVPGWTDRSVSTLPSVLQPDVVPLPSWAATILG